MDVGCHSWSEYSVSSTGFVTTFKINITVTEGPCTLHPTTYPTVEPTSINIKLKLPISQLIPTLSPTIMPSHSPLQFDGNEATTITPAILVITMVAAAFICFVIVSVIILKRRKYKNKDKNIMDTKIVHIRINTDKNDSDKKKDKNKPNYEGEKDNIVLDTALADVLQESGYARVQVLGAADIMDTVGKDEGIENLEIEALQQLSSAILEDMYDDVMQSITPKVTPTTPDSMMQQMSAGSMTAEDVITNAGAVTMGGNNNYLEWDQDDIFEWIIGLNQSFAKYADVLKESLKEEDVKGSDLVDMDTLHIKGLGVDDRSDRQKLFDCIQELVKAQEGDEGYSGDEGDV